MSADGIKKMAYDFMRNGALSNIDALWYLADPAPGAFDFGAGGASLLPLDLLNIATLGLM